jgi:hypothetical protein
MQSIEETMEREQAISELAHTQQREMARRRNPHRKRVFNALISLNEVTAVDNDDLKRKYKLEAGPGSNQDGNG